MFILPFVRLIHTPPGINIVFQFVNSPLLFFFTDMQKKLHDQIPVICKLTLIAPDARHPFFISVIIHDAHKSVSGHLIHPAGIHEYEFSRLRNLLEIPP